MRERRKIYSIDNQNYLIDTEKHCLYDVKSIGALKNGYRLFSCLIDDIDNNISVKVCRWGSVNEDFEEVIPCRYEYLSEFCDNIYHATILNPTRIGECSDKKFYFFVNENGIPVTFYDIDDNGIRKKLIVKFESFIATSEFKKGLAVGLSHDKKQGVLRSDGSLLLEPKYDAVYLDVYKRYITTKKEDDYRTILYFSGKKRWLFIPQGYLFKEYNTEEKHFILSYGDKIAVMDFDANILIPPIYKKLFFYEDCIIATDSNNKKGLLQRSNPSNVLLDFEFSSIKFYYSQYLMEGSSEYLTVIKNKHQGIYSLKKGCLILPINFPEDVELLLGTLGEDLIGFHKYTADNGFMNIDGNVVFTFAGNFINGFRDGVARIYSRNKWKKIDKLGNVIEEGEIDTTMYETETEEASYYTEEDTWDAMTDGMYGDYPGNVDYESLGY